MNHTINEIENNKFMAFFVTKNYRYFIVINDQSAINFVFNEIILKSNSFYFYSISINNNLRIYFYFYSYSVKAIILPAS